MYVKLNATVVAIDPELKSIIEVSFCGHSEMKNTCFKNHKKKL